MNIVQSLWTLPMLKGSKKISENRFHGGWPHVKYHLLSLAYSCMQLSRFYKKLSLVTDEIGYNILIDTLQLPYTDVSVKLDTLNGYDPQLWSIGKVYTYSLQNEPFLHVDGDVYIWEPFGKEIESAELVAQSLEHNFDYYKSIKAELIEKNCYVPAVITKITEQENEANAYNAGVFGGGNIDFFKSFIAEIETFLKNNTPCFQYLEVGKLNAFFEQQLFYCMSKEWNLKVNCVSNIIDKKKLDFMLTDPGRFAKTPGNVKYMHMYGNDAKNDPQICSRLETLVSDKYPDVYQRVLQACDSAIVNMFTTEPAYAGGKKVDI